MSTKFKLKVNNIFDFEMDQDTIQNLDIVETSIGKYHIIHENKSIRAEILESHFNNKEYEVKVNNTSYSIKISNELDLLIEKMGFAQKNTKNINHIKAPMPGLIIDLQIKVGQEVKENDPLLILEAMKMENIIKSPRDGVIKSISAHKGDAVQKNQLLIEFE